MSKRIQAYFRTENEAEGAKTALIAYKVEGLEVSPLTDPLGRGRNLLFPVIVPLNDASITAGAMGTLGTASTPAASAAMVPGVAVPGTLEGADSDHNRDEFRDSSDVADGDLDNLHYVMELKATDENYHEVVQIIRGKGAYVEIFE